MKNSRHTPGPWVCKKYPKVFGIMAESGRQIAIMTEHHGDEPNTPMHQFERSPQDKADASLIAAAPEMLEALEAALFVGEKLHHLVTNENERLISVTNLATLQRTIAKARGEK